MASKAGNKKPTSTSTTSAYTGPKGWNIIYPVYINSKKTIAEGRRAPKADCVENPTLQGMFEALKTLGIQCEVELEKMHPRDYGVMGRIKVKLFTEDDKPVNPEIKSKDELLIRICKSMPNKSSSSGGGGSNTSTTTESKKNKKNKK